MPANYYYPTSKNAIQKTLAAQLLSTATTGDAITFDDVEGIQNKPGVLVINRVDANGVSTPSAREFISFSERSGSTVLIETRNVDSSGAARTHAVGSIVEFIADAVWGQRVIDQALVEHNIDGTHNSKQISEGWTPITETFTYASPTTITIASGGASRFQKGDKLKLTNVTVKYFYIVTVADTLLTVTGGSDYALASGAITSPYLSRIENPFGFPTWFNYTPTYAWTGATAPTAGPTTGNRRFRIGGSLCTVNIMDNGYSGASNITSANITLPVTASPSLQGAYGYANVTSSLTGAVTFINGAKGYVEFTSVSLDRFIFMATYSF